VKNELAKSIPWFGKASTVCREKSFAVQWFSFFSGSRGRRKNFKVFVSSFFVVFVSSHFLPRMNDEFSRWKFVNLIFESKQQQKFSLTHELININKENQTKIIVQPKAKNLIIGRKREEKEDSKNKKQKVRIDFEKSKRSFYGWSQERSMRTEFLKTDTRPSPSWSSVGVITKQNSRVRHCGITQLGRCQWEAINQPSA
jgi:hypothetical protein